MNSSGIQWPGWVGALEAILDANAVVFSIGVGQLAAEARGSSPTWPRGDHLGRRGRKGRRGRREAAGAFPPFQPIPPLPSSKRSVYGAAQTKFAASSVLPVPVYRATWG